MSPYAQTRREFLRHSVKGLSLAALSPFAPSFLLNSVWSQAAGGLRPWTDNNNGRILVVIQLGGGNDGLNAVVPYANDDYYRARPEIGIPATQVLKLNDALGLHSQLEPFKRLHDAGQFSVIQGVGYPNPNRSHFHSMEIWHAGLGSEARMDTGWLGRYFDAQCSGTDLPSPAVGVNVGKVMPNAFRNLHSLGVSLERPSTYQWQPSGESKELVRAQKDIFLNLNSPSGGEDPMLDLLQHTGMNAQLSSDKVRAAVSSYKSKVTYPSTSLGYSMGLIAQMIAGGMETRVYYAHQGGYDTHNNQVGTHDRLLGDLALSCESFQKDLQAIGAADRVVTLVFSEFGRRVGENASGGTDHGAAAPVFMMGSKLKGGVIGAHPSLTDLEDGDLKFTTDFRQVYASVLQDWLNAPAATILGKEFSRLPLV